MTQDELAKALRGCSVVLEIESVSHLTSHNCFLVNDAFLLSYREAESIYQRSQTASTFAGRLNALAERLVGWSMQAIYRCCFAGQKAKMLKPISEEKASNG